MLVQAGPSRRHQEPSAVREEEHRQRNEQPTAADGADDPAGGDEYDREPERGPAETVSLLRDRLVVSYVFPSRK